MFAEIKSPSSGPRRVAPPLSMAVHCALLAWLIHSPRPIFVAPSSIVRGEGGTRVTRLYWPGRSLDTAPIDFGVTAPASLGQKTAPARLAWPQSPRATRKGRRVPSRNAPQEEIAKENNTGPNPGSPYGSLAQGPISGMEVRPALPIRASDPRVYPGELHEEGDVIVEITIDAFGNIVAKKVLHSLSPTIDQKVLLALDSWHFQPATRDGIPIPSKQDVHYHFKPS